jgi:hypothetical protein
MKTAILVRERLSENERWTDEFEVADGVDFEAALREAVAEFLKTEDGKQARLAACDDFNWGDAIMYVPDECWAKHGLKMVTDSIETLRVNQDELL